MHIYRAQAGFWFLCLRCRPYTLFERWLLWRNCGCPLLHLTAAGLADCKRRKSQIKPLSKCWRCGVCPLSMCSKARSAWWGLAGRHVMAVATARSGQALCSRGLAHSCTWEWAAALCARWHSRLHDGQACVPFWPSFNQVPFACTFVCLSFVHWRGHVHAHYAVHKLFLERLEMHVLCAIYNNGLRVSEKRPSLDAPRIFGLPSYPLEMRGIVHSLPSLFFLFFRQVCAAKHWLEPLKRNYGLDAWKCKNLNGFIGYWTYMNPECGSMGD